MPEFPTTRHVLEPGCARCPDLVEHRERISWGTGDPDASVFVIGEAPGYGNPDADRWRGGNWTGQAYTSRHSGRRVRGLLESVGFADDAYYTNAVKCFPADEAPRASSASGEAASPDSAEPTTNREPTVEERATCRGHLLAELESVSPEVVLATGKHATASVLEANGESLDGFLETVLEPRWCGRLEVWLLPILHPSYQDVWIGRLGYDAESYVVAIQEGLDGVLEAENGRANGRLE